MYRCLYIATISPTLNLYTRYPYCWVARVNMASKFAQDILHMTGFVRIEL